MRIAEVIKAAVRQLWNDYVVVPYLACIWFLGGKDLCEAFRWQYEQRILKIQAEAGDYAYRKTREYIALAKKLDDLEEQRFYTEQYPKACELERRINSLRGVIQNLAERNYELTKRLAAYEEPDDEDS
jgi:hypothetical protein